MKLYLIIDIFNNTYYIVTKTIEKAIEIANKKIKENDEKGEIKEITLTVENIIIGD